MLEYRSASRRYTRPRLTKVSAMVRSATEANGASAAKKRWRCARRHGDDTRALTPGDTSVPKRLATRLAYRIGRTSACPRFFSSFTPAARPPSAAKVAAPSRARGCTHSAPVSQSKPIRPSATQLYRHLRTHRTMFGRGGMKEFWRDSGKSHTREKQGQCCTFRNLHGLDAKPTCRVLPTFYFLANPLPRVGYRLSLWWSPVCNTDQKMCSVTGQRAETALQP